jgi:opacity protein-like surface antigen
MRARTLVGVSLAAVLAAAVPARADSLLTPFVGANLNGTASVPVGTFFGDSSHTSFGVSFAVMGGGVFGAEADLGYSPKFFGTDVQVGAVPVSLAKNNVTTAMFNLTAGVPIQGRSGVGIRPYAVGGIGLIRQRIEAVGELVNYTTNDFGYDVGGGVVIFLGSHVGIRGDIRYFRTTGTNPITSLVNLDLGELNFTRASVGITFRY